MYRTARLACIAASLTVWTCANALAETSGRLNSERMAPIAPAPTASAYSCADLNDQELALYEHVKNVVSPESFAAIPWHMKKMLAIVAVKAASGALDGKLVPAYCFDGDVPADVIEYLNSAYYRSGGEKFNEIQDRWTLTASPGTGSSQGSPAVITYSFVPDGTQIMGDPSIIDTETSNPMADGPSNLFAFMNGIYGSPAVWQPLFQQVFDQWSSVTGITYVFEPSDDGAAFPESGESSGEPGVLGVRGDVRIAGLRIDGQTGGNILAFNYFPNTGDMLIDTSNSGYYGSTGGSSIRLRNVVAHEHGHGVGMPHTCPPNNTKLMEPFIALTFDGVQPDDRLSGQRTYGDVHEKSGGNDNSGTATDMGVITNSSASVNTVSIDDDTDVDFYSFTTTQNADITVTLTPIGTTYLSGEQLENDDCTPGSSFNALAVANLNIELLGSNGSTVLATGASAAAGAVESISSFNLASPGTYFVRVLQAAAVNNVQGYNITIAAAAAPLATSISVTPGTWVEEGVEVIFTVGPAGASAYQWFKNDDAIGGATAETYIIPAAVIVDSGSYYCQVTTDSKEIGNTDTVQLVVFAAGSLPTGQGVVAGLLVLTLALLALARVRRGRRFA